MHSVQIKISDIVFSIFTDWTFDLFFSDDTYRNFLSTGPQDVTIYGHYSGAPDIPLPDENKVFESGTFWDGYRIESRTVFALKAPVLGPRPYCVAVFDEGFRTGDVYFYPQAAEKPDILLPFPLAFPLFHLLLISRLAQGYGVLIHACGIDDRGRGYLFPGSSSHGKTTMARIWRKNAVILNDERVVLRQNNGKLWIYGTPWHGEFNGISPGGVPLEKIFFLNHAKSNDARHVAGITAASMLLSHCFQPFWDKEGMRFILDFCARASSDVPCFDLDFVPNEEIVDFVQCVK